MDALLSPLGLSVSSFVLLIVSVLWVKLPISVLLAVLGFGGMVLLNGMETACATIASEVWGSFSAYSMTVIPLFLLMGQICFYSGVNERLYKAINTMAGHVPGGLSVATLLACAGFSAICGSNTATAATMAGVALPEMRRYGYNDAFSAGTVAVGATLGVVIPPSVALIIIGLQTGLSVSHLFASSIIPGVMLVLAFIFCGQATLRRHPGWAPSRPAAPVRERIAAIPQLLEVALLWGGVLGGMCAGVVTPTEAGGLGSLIALVMGVATRRLTLQGIACAVADTLRITAMILLLITSAMIYGKFLNATRLPFELSSMIAGLHAPGMLVLLCMLAIYFVGGMLMDALALLLITLPIFFPLAQSLGFDPYWFSLVITVVTTVGAVTPPVGVCPYVVASMDRSIPLPDIFKGIACYFPAYAIVVALLMVFPWLII